MKKNIINMTGIFAVFMLALTIAQGGCSKPMAPAHTTPVDPDSPNFVEPGVTIIAGPSEGSTTNSSTIVFAWTRTSGYTSWFSIRMDSLPWSIKNDTTATYNNLSEGHHTFQIKSFDVGGYEGKVTVVRNFTANAVNNTVLMYPPTQNIAVGETAEVWCELEDMATPVSGIRLLIYVSNPSYIDTIGASADTGYYWRRNGGTPVGPFFNNYGVNYLDVSLGVAAGTPAGVTGTGRIFKIKARAVVPGTMYMYIYSITARDTLNNPVTTTNPSSSSYIYISGKKEGAR